MAATKKKDNELATTATNTALAQRAANIEWQMDGADDSDLITPFVRIFQDDDQSDKLGEHKKGALVDASTQEEIQDTLLVPIHAKKTYIKWDPDNPGKILDRTDNPNEVPEGGLDWTENANGDDTPPEWTTHANFFVLFRGSEFPSVLSLPLNNKYRIKVSKFINTIMTRRTAAGKGPCFFEIWTHQVSNEKNQKWFEIDAKARVETPLDEAMIEALETWGRVKKDRFKTEHETAEPGETLEDAPY